MNHSNKVLKWLDDKFEASKTYKPVDEQLQGKWAGE